MKLKVTFASTVEERLSRTSENICSTHLLNFKSLFSVALINDRDRWREGEEEMGGQGERETEVLY